MDLAKYRKSLGLSQEECARALGVSSKGYISDIERRQRGEPSGRAASLNLAMRIEQWSGGKVRAAELNADAAAIAKMKPGEAA